jgi:hypothetical protein
LANTIDTPAPGEAQIIRKLLLAKCALPDAATQSNALERFREDLRKNVYNMYTTECNA